MTDSSRADVRKIRRSVGSVAAVVSRRRAQRAAPPGENGSPWAFARSRRWRPGPYLTLTGVIFGPLCAVAVWARLFLSAEREPDCIDWCMSDRSAAYFLLFVVAYFAVPAWALLMGALGALRLFPAVRGWPVIGQVAAVLAIAAVVGAPIGAALLKG